MTEEDKRIKKKMERLINYGKCNGLSEYADDYAQEVLLANFINPSRRSTINQYLRDFRRTYWGDLRISSGIFKSNQYRQYEEYIEGSSYDTRIIDESTEDACRLFQKLYNIAKIILNKRELKIFKYYYIYDYSGFKIAKILAITEARVNQIKSTIISKIKKYIKYPNAFIINKKNNLSFGNNNII